nr:hypothetical protein [Tanacetum cinerariifolium]
DYNSEKETTAASPAAAPKFGIDLFREKPTRVVPPIEAALLGIAKLDGGRGVIRGQRECLVAAGGWQEEGLYNLLEHPSTLVPYLRFTKLFVGHYINAYPEISRRVHDKYHNLEHDEIVKSIFNSRKNKAGVGMKILSWMITDEMKLTENYQMYAEVFRVDVPTTQSQPIESTQGMHRTTSAPRALNPDVAEGESSAQQNSTVIRFHIPPR